jgi:cytochrome c oxidase subunit 4
MKDSAMDARAKDTHLVPYRVYVAVWAALVVLTGLTVGAHAAREQMHHIATFTAILIATVKVSLVVLYFMHLRFERRIFVTMILTVLAVYAVFVILIFVDYPFR